MISDSWPESWLRKATQYGMTRIDLTELQARKWAELILTMRVAGVSVSIYDIIHFIDYERIDAHSLPKEDTMTEESRYDVCVWRDPYSGRPRS